MEKVGLWKDEYRTGIEEIDIQHRQLFDKIERLILIAKNGDIEKNRLECNDIVDFLADYTISHFASEEALQKRLGYVNYEQHVKLHQQFKNTVLKYKKNMETDFSRSLLKSFVGTLLTWLVMHVCTCDKKIITNEPIDPRKDFSNKESLIRSVAETCLTSHYGIPIVDMQPCIYKGYVEGRIIVRTLITVQKKYQFLYGFSETLAKAIYLKASSMYLENPDDLDDMEKSAFIEIGNSMSTYAVMQHFKGRVVSMQSEGEIYRDKFTDSSFDINNNILLDISTKYGNLEIMYCNIP